jgi:uncharacterized SAM-binding protein YcdF (DUF218 family)
VVTVITLYVLHQDFWFWRSAKPLVFGFIPIGLFYHACFTVAASLVMWVLVRHAWPIHLEQEIEHLETGGGGLSHNQEMGQREAGGDNAR